MTLLCVLVSYIIIPHLLSDPVANLSGLLFLCFCRCNGLRKITITIIIINWYVLRLGVMDYEVIAVIGLQNEVVQCGQCIYKLNLVIYGITGAALTENLKTILQNTKCPLYYVTERRMAQVEQLLLVPRPAGVCA